MYSRIMTASLFGLECEKVWVECNVEQGLMAFSIVGLVNQSIKESKERVRSAISNCLYSFPDTRITVNLTPAGVKKNGSHFDLAIALGVLASSGEINICRDISDIAFLGELTLDGRINPVDGILPMVIGLREIGIKKVVVPEANVDEACLVNDVEVFPVSCLTQVVDFICKRIDICSQHGSSNNLEYQNNVEDFLDIKGQESVKRAAQIAAAGFHGLLMIGPPGVGKSMVGKRIPGIMPKLSYNQQLEVTQIYSISGNLNEKDPIIRNRPFRAPHHSITSTAMVGGGAKLVPGEVSLAHHGVLFLDELPEFSSSVLETLRQPLENGEVSISRVSGSFTYPARFMLVAAMNPCKCGYYGDPTRRCICSSTDRQKYIGKISGPLLDRIDLHVVIQRPSYADLSSNKRNISSDELRIKIEKAIAIQYERYKELNISYNSQLSPNQIKKYCSLNDESVSIMEDAFKKWKLSARSYHKILKLARTIADLDESNEIKTEHILEALTYRIPDTFFKA